MATFPQSPVSTPERIFNALPIGFSSWLDFYDAIPEWHRVREDIQFVNPTSKEDFLRVHGREPQSSSDKFLISYEMRKDFLLARCAEQLLAARLSDAQLSKMTSLFYDDWTDIPDYLVPLLEAARSIVRK